MGIFLISQPIFLSQSDVPQIATGFIAMMGVAPIARRSESSGARAVDDCLSTHRQISIGQVAVKRK